MALVQVQFLKESTVVYIYIYIIYIYNTHIQK